MLKKMEDQFQDWLFDVNGEMSQVGANQVDLKQGDVIDWKLEAFKQ